MRQTGQRPEELDQDLPYQSLPVREVGTPFQMLAGVRVVDVTTSIAGPYATMLLSDFGAEVVKVERPEGDDTRAWGPPFLESEALWFTSVNRNKKSVVIDAATSEGKENLLSLISSADIFVTNQPPAVQRKLGLDYESLRRTNESLVFVSITGFGLTGERADLTCYDLIAEGYSGIMDITGEPGSPPQKVGAPAADMLAGQDAAMAAMAALHHTQKTGEGHCVDVSLVESMTRFLTCRISPYMGSGLVPSRTGGRDSVIAIYQSFDTLDKPMNLGLGNDAIWKRFWSCVGDTDYGSSARFKSNSDRHALRPEIVKRIQSILITKPRDEWLDLFADARVPAGPINRLDEVVGDGALQARGMFFGLRDGSGRISPQVGLGIGIDGRTSSPCAPPPRLGEHTSEILGQLKSEQ
jgi:crotonobetainyl-CoA:carnitine CoA-transferase CaiB-like acyl-CoA transferase